MRALPFTFCSIRISTETVCVLNLINGLCGNFCVVLEAGRYLKLADSISKLPLAIVAPCQRRHCDEALENVHKVTSFGLLNIKPMVCKRVRQPRGTREVSFFTSRQNLLTYVNGNRLSHRGPLKSTGPHQS